MQDHGTFGSARRPGWGFFDVTALLAIAAALLSGVQPVQATDAYPTKAVRWIVPFPSGSLLDIRSRFVAGQLSEYWKQQVVIDNRPGAGGIIGTQLAGTAPPDGYTLLLGTITTLAINPGLYRRLPYDAARDFSPVILIAAGPLVLTVPPAPALNSAADLIALARRRPHELSYASIGSGSTQHITMELFKQITNTQMRHIPYKETSAALGDVLSDRVNVMFESQPAIEQHLKSGRLKALAVTETRRSLGLPDVPTLNEAGVPGYEFSGWNGIVVAAGTPRVVVTKLHDAVAHVLARPATVENFAATGSRTGGGSSREFAHYIEAERSKWSNVIQAAKIAVD
jgi:tripartite-type tricarboxylate transporter receptor subunit TctC